MEPFFFWPTFFQKIIKIFLHPQCLPNFLQWIKKCLVHLWTFSYASLRCLGFFWSTQLQEIVQNRQKWTKMGQNGSRGPSEQIFWANFFSKTYKLFSTPPMVTKPFLMDRKVFGAPLNVFLRISAMSSLFFGASNSKRSSKIGQKWAKMGPSDKIFWPTFFQKIIKFLLFLQWSPNLF